MCIGEAVEAFEGLREPATSEAEAFWPGHLEALRRPYCAGARRVAAGDPP